MYVHSLGVYFYLQGIKTEKREFLCIIIKSKNVLSIWVSLCLVYVSKRAKNISEVIIEY
jgi:hypothetical protein